MIGDLLARAAALSLAYWLSLSALVALSGLLIVLWLARWGDDFDRRGR